MPYCLYVRKSRADAEAEARGDGETLARHIHALLDLAKRRHFDVTQIYKEIVSGETIAARPVMQQLLADVEQGVWDGVLVMEVERLARGDTVDQGIVAQTFKFSDTKIITPMKDYNPNNEFDEEYFEFGLFMSRREYKTINRRLQRGRMASVQEGKYVCSQSPYGYDRQKLENDKGYTLTPKPEEADTVRMIFDWYTKGEPQEDGSFRRLGVSLIARRLNELHIPPRKSEHWVPATVRDMLTNPVYVGMIRWNWRKGEKRMQNGKVTASRPRSSPEDCILVKGLHPPLVDRETFDTAQQFMSQNPPHPIPEHSKVMNPLSGLVVCAKCGKRMVRRPYNNRTKEDTLICPYTHCDNVGSFLSAVERRILASLNEWIEEYRVGFESSEEETKARAAIAAKEKNLRRLTTEYATLNKQLDTAHDLLEQGVYTTEQFLDRSRKLSDRIKQNETERVALDKDIALDRQRETARREIIPKVEHLLLVYHTLDSPKAKNEMLKEVIERVTYLKTQSGRWHGSPDDFEIALFPRIPK